MPRSSRIMPSRLNADGLSTPSAAAAGVGCSDDFGMGDKPSPGPRPTCPVASEEAVGPAEAGLNASVSFPRWRVIFPATAMP